MFARFKRFRFFSRRVPTPLRLALGLAFMVAFATVLLALPISGSHRPLTWNEAFFTATSALTVTGLTIITPGADLSLFGQIILLTLIQIGGVGFMVVAVIVFRLLGRSVSFADRLALRDSFGLLDLNAIISLTRRVLMAVLGLETFGAFLFWIHWRKDLGDVRGAFYALFHAVSAFCNAGFDLFAGTPGFTGIPNDNFSLLVFGVLIFIGGLGIPVVGELIMMLRGSHRRMSLHTRLTLIASAALVVLGTAGLLWAESRPGAIFEHVSLDRAFALSLFQSISARTAGFSALPNFEELSGASQLLKISLMYVGTAPASMGGGITTSSFIILVLALWAFARGRETPHIFGRSIGKAMTRRASAVLTVSLLVTIGISWLLLMLNPQADLNKVIFEVVSAFATCGLSLGYTSQLGGLGQILIVFVMFWGRLGALTIILALAQLTPPRLVEYPEEQILI
jgi:trk system potassium uptake protein